MRPVGVVALVIAVSLMALSGCGGSTVAHSAGADASSLQDVGHELEGWTAEVERLTKRADQHGTVATDFHVPRPKLSPADLRYVSPDGFRIGVSTDLSVIEMKNSTYLYLQEIKSMYCYLFSWYLSHGRYPEPQEFTEVVFSYVGTRVIRNTPRQRLEGAINLLREAIDSAQNGGEAVRNAAIATVCTVPTRGGG